jgi:hypothetical protein
MKLLSIDSTRMTELFQARRADSQPNLPQLAAALAERYSFIGSPTSLAELTDNHIEFSHGVFENGSIEKLDVYNDGVVISARATSDFVEAFLNDFMHWIQEDLGMEVWTSRGVTRLYDSELVVELDPSVMNVLEQLNGISRKLSTMIAENCGMNIDYHALGFGYSCDQALSRGHVPSSFRLERRLASEFQLNQFISIAPLKTSQHLELLESIESAARTG